MMNVHERYADMLPLFVAGQLDDGERGEMENHLLACPVCQADLALWNAVSSEVRETSRRASPPSTTVDAALTRARAESMKREQDRGPNAMRRAWGLLRSQAFLVQREIWPVCAAVMALGIIVALLSKQIGAIYFLAPLVAAASLSLLFNPENDPAYELTLATPTSPWKVLLARLSIISTYNLLLSLVAALVLLVIIPPGFFGTLVLGWLAPMAFLSALALLLSLWIGTGNAIALTYILWIAQYMPHQAIYAWMVSPAWKSAILAYQGFWHSPALLFLLSALLMTAALWSANRPAGRLVHEIG